MKFKRVFAVLLACICLCSMAVGVKAAPTSPYRDVSTSFWGYEDVMYVTDQQLMMGVDVGSFAPDMTLSRGMLATVLWRVQGSPYVKEPAPFTDLEQDWYKMPVAWAAKNGIVNGVGNGRFAPEEDITREQLVVMLYRYTESCDYVMEGSVELTRFKDRETVSSWAAEAMKWGVGNGLINGMEDASGNPILAPGATCTRAQAAAMIHRYVILKKVMKPGNPSISGDIVFDEANRLKIVAYNIRCANDGNGKNIEDRAPRLLAFLEKYDPDIIGLQECSFQWINYLEEGAGGHIGLLGKYGEYDMRYTWRAEVNLESTPVLWKKDKFELLAEGHYWLSETPDKESKGWGAAHYRICNWVKLKVKATGKIFIFVNTHLSGGVPGVNSASLIAQRATRVGGFDQYPVIFTGDLNDEPQGDTYKAFINAGFLDLNEQLGFDYSHTNDGYNLWNEDEGNRKILEYIMYDSENGIIPLEYEVKNEKYYEGWISDQRGVYGELALK